MTLTERQLQAAKALANLYPDLVELLPLPTCEDCTLTLAPYLHG